MNWRVATSLIELFKEVNVKWPNRRKDSDGTIGDQKHASRSSDHNPWVHDSRGQPVVTAIDITHDPASGCDSYTLAQHLIDSRDRRIKYVISNGRIAAGTDGPQPWVWRKYTGANKHDHHCHISVKSDEALFDSQAPWSAVSLASAVAAPNSVESYVAPLPTLRVSNARSELVRLLQKRLTEKGFSVKVDGYFGAGTKAVVMKYQKSVGIDDDGIVGPSTWNHLNK